MFQPAEPGQRGTTFQVGVIAAPGQHIVFGEHGPAAQAGWRIVRDVKDEIDVSLFGLPRQGGGIQIDKRQPDAGGLFSQGVEHGLDDRDGAIVGGGNAPDLPRAGGVEGGWRCDGLRQTGQCLLQGRAQGIGAGRWAHAARAGQQQGIGKDLAQACQLHADRGLCQMQPFCGAGHAVFGQQGIERDQQIQVDAAQGIVQGNTCHFGNSFPL